MGLHFGKEYYYHICVKQLAYQGHHASKKITRKIPVKQAMNTSPPAMKYRRAGLVCTSDCDAKLLIFGI